ncbi:MAG: outer membrane beta-barrel protein [Bacteroidota bacterium]|nr:outer membrane beta-barrel protein [Ferruginibacter sp.]
MKKMIAVSLLTGMVMCTKAQFYVQGGLNLANITETKSGETEKNNILPTFNAGVLGRFGLSDVFDLETGALLTGRGSKAESYYNNGADYIKAKFNPLYIEVPLNAVVKFPIGTTSKSNVFIHGGPYAAIGIGGTSKFDSKFGPLTASGSNDIKFNDDDPTTTPQEGAAYDRLKRFDFGLNFGGGVDFGKLILKANYGLGLAKINSTEQNNSVDDKNKYRTLSFSVGIPLGGR